MNLKTTLSCRPLHAALPLLAALSLAAAAPAFAQQQPLAAAIAASAGAYKAKSPKLTRAEVDALLARPEQVVVIDLRRPDEHTKIGAFPVFLSIQSRDLEKSLAFIPRDRTVITVSNHAGRAGAAADLLASRGFKVAGATGVQDYEAEGGTVAHIAPPAPAASAVAAAATRP